MNIKKRARELVWWWRAFLESTNKGQKVWLSAVIQLRSVSHPDPFTQEEGERKERRKGRREVSSLGLCIQRTYFCRTDYRSARLKGTQESVPMGS